MLASSPSCTLLFSHMKAFALSEHTRSFTPPIILSHCFTCVLLTSATSLCKNVMSTSRHILNSTYSGKVFCLLCACSCSTVSYSLRLRGVKPIRLLCPWDFPGKNTRVGCHFLLQGIFPGPELNPYLLHLLHWLVDSLPLGRFFTWEVPGSPRSYETVREEEKLNSTLLGSYGWSENETDVRQENNRK